MRMFKAAKSAYGGELRNTRAGRSHARPLAVRESMHLVLRSTQAKGPLSFLRPRNDKKVRDLVEKFSRQYGVRIISFANVGNHLHMQIRLGSRFAFTPFIRALTGAIAMAVTGRTRWTKRNGDAAIDDGTNSNSAAKFWDRRPFTRIVHSFRAHSNLKNYVRINELEALGFSRNQARDMAEVEKLFAGSG